MMNQYKLNKELNCYELILHDAGYNYVETVLIDLEDYDKVKEYNWYKNKEGAISATDKDRPRLSRLILNMGKSRIRVKYKNGNKLDNRKCNLDLGDVKKKTEECRYTGIEGVGKRPNGTYEAYITYQQKRLYLGSSKDIYEAIGMRKRAEYVLEYHKNNPGIRPLLYVPQDDYVLDFNRRTNHTLNEYKWNYVENCYEMLIYNRNNQIIGSCFIDKDDYDKVKDIKWGMNHEYVSTKLNGKEMKLHRFIINARPDQIVDHINRNKLDNRKKNLRFLSSRENVINTGLRSNNTSGCTGVFIERGMWHAIIIVNKKRIDLGFYDNFDDARLARKQAEYVYGYAQIKGSPLLYIPDGIDDK